MADYSKYKDLKIEVKEKIATIMINRPEGLNAVTDNIHREFETIFGEIDQDDSVNVAIITGAGKAFSAGGDIKWMLDMVNDPASRIPVSRVKKLLQELVAMRKPTIAAINGHCVGLGASIALCCDITIMSEKAAIGDPHNSVGLVAGDGGILIWPLLVGLNKAKECIFTSALVKAPDAAAMGLVNKVVPPEQVMVEAWKLAKQFADGPIQAISWTKVCLNKILQDRINLLFDATASYEALSMATADHAEGVKAFLEKRPAQFKGGPL